MASFPRVCKRCHQSKPVSDFSKNTPRKDGLQQWCQSCTSAYKKEYYQRNREKVKATSRAYDRKYRLRNDLRQYNITPQQYHEMLERQGGFCAICGGSPSTRRLHVDHDHRTGIVRALLCGGCNTGIGQFKDNPALLQRAAQYLIGHGNQ